MAQSNIPKLSVISADAASMPRRLYRVAHRAECQSFVESGRF